MKKLKEMSWKVKWFCFESNIYQFKPGLKPELLVHLFYKGGAKQEKKKLKGTPTLLNWKVVHDRMPWNIVLLLGGGFALAKGSEVRG